MKNLVKSFLTVSAVATMSILPGLSTIPAFAAIGWQKDANGWWYSVANDNSNWHHHSWQWLDGNDDGIAECYYFDDIGYILTNTTTPDGYTVNADGAWVQNGTVQTKAVTTYTKASTTSHASTTSFADSSSDSTSRSMEELAYEMVELINQDRAKYGVPELEIDDTLMDFAAMRAAQLSEWFSHTRPDGTRYTSELADSYHYRGENITKKAQGYYYSPSEAENSLMHSSGHKKNILNDNYTVVGVGVYESDGTYYYCQVFAIPGASTSSTSSTSSMSDEEFQSWAKSESGWTDEEIAAGNIKFYRPGEGTFKVNYND